MFKLVPYQEDAVNRLIKAFKELLLTDHQDMQIVFKSPTGSGKTVMTAEALKRIAAENSTGELVFLWASMNKLHLQSKRKLSDFLSDSRYRLIGLEDLTAEALPANTILFANWESMIKTKRETGEWSNLAVKRGENMRNIVDVLETTRLAGRTVVLIVDEAHQTYLGPKSQRLVKTIIKPRLTIEVSATPLLHPSGEDITDNKARIIKVPFDEVVNSGLIKQETRINYQIEEHLAKQSSDEAIIEAALSRRNVLEQAYLESGSHVKPLVLIQLPTEDTEKTSVLDQTVRVKIEVYLQSKNITYKNGRLAIWLSEEKTNKDNIEAMDSPVEVLIFKKAIATGWDCPRAQIMVMLHDMRSEVFKIQTVGRILRMAEGFHYDNAELNAAYVYTNLGSIIVDPDSSDAKGFFVAKNAVLRDGIANVKLPSVFLHRTDFHDLTAAFRPILFRYLDDFFGFQSNDSTTDKLRKLDNVLELDPNELQKPILSDITVGNLDEIDKAQVQTLSSTLDTIQVQNIFHFTLKGWTAPYNFTRSIERLKPALYDWFARAGYGRDRIDEIQRVLVCSETNQNFFTALINNAKQEFERIRLDDVGIKRSITNLSFEIPEALQYGDNYSATPSDKHALQPYYARTDRPETEARFEQQLDKSNLVDWWFKNGEKLRQYFAIPYVSSNAIPGTTTLAAFYPDYIVRYNDGSIAIYDTKAGMTLMSDETAAKAEALRQYIVQHSSNEQKLTGGIVDARRDQSFWVNEAAEYNAKEPRDWTLLKL